MLAIFETARFCIVRDFKYFGQCVLKPGIKVEDLTELDILKTEYRGSLATITVRGSRENVERQMAACEPLFFELIPLSLEEIFISETEVAGYDIKKLIF